MEKGVWSVEGRAADGLVRFAESARERPPATMRSGRRWSRWTIDSPLTGAYGLSTDARRHPSGRPGPGEARAAV